MVKIWFQKGCRGAVVLGLVALAAGCGQGPEVSTDRRDAARVLICVKCGFAEEASGELIQQRYAEGQVRPGGPTSPWFSCSECGEVAAAMVVVELSFSEFKCTSCGAEGPSDAGGVVQAARGGGAQLTPDGELQLHCLACDTFTSVRHEEE